MSQNVDAQDYELIVVDDGSVSAIMLEGDASKPTMRVVRLEGDGPSSARNEGARAALGELLVFVDDDMLIDGTFLASHWQAHLEFPGALQVGAIRLPETAMATPFGRFRQRLEDDVVPESAGPVEAQNFCTAANMSIERELFERLEGFDPELSTGEDQDLALRHTDRGGRIVFVPAARAVHDDDALGLESYCERAERYMEELVRFGVRHPELPDSVERVQVNGSVRVGREPAALSAKKVLKSALIRPPLHALALHLASLVERVAPESRLLDRVYRLHLGAHLQRGYRRGLRSA